MIVLTFGDKKKKRCYVYVLLLQYQCLVYLNVNVFKYWRGAILIPIYEGNAKRHLYTF